MDEAARSHYAKVEEAWDGSRPVHAAADRAEFDRIAAEIARYLKPDGGKRLLDVGCGTGETMASLTEKGFECWGFDFAQTKVSQASLLNPGKVWKQSFLDPFQQGPFDRIVSYAVLQYCRPSDMQLVLRNTLAALTIGGQAAHCAIPAFELYEFANGVYFNASSEAELAAYRKRLIASAMDGRPIFEDGTFFHSHAKMRELVVGAGHEFHVHPSRTRYRVDIEIVKRG